MWNYFFKKRRIKNMSDTTTKVVKALKTDVQTQQQLIESQDSKISSLRTRISELADENHLLQSQLTKLRDTVAEDIKYLYTKLT
jgi:cell division protein FtsB